MLVYLVYSVDELLALGWFFAQITLFELVANLHTTLNM